ncbi:MAG: 2Fe-2S iron-sulfur cluster binding domain-containing protein [Granulosicoccus sp.]|nr:2Fe-2S iron-sulfur cluster binding domain-containing protein [Granulosicoccus sp.]
MTQEIILHYKLADGTIRTVDARVGDSIMDTAIQNDIDEVVAECGGNLICATCHVYLDEGTAALFEEPDDMELEMLEGVAAERREHSRLSCQLIVRAELAGHTIETPERQ